nr:MAG TPA: hypothetical protein [Caudoviricetes sp.]DAU24707.1 MAG TPA: hypothetical protein [Caudoviricetes sp.]
MCSFLQSVARAVNLEALPLPQRFFCFHVI